MRKPRLLRITTVPISLHLLLQGQLHYMGTKGFEVLAVSSDGPERASLLGQGISHTIVPFSRTISLLRDVYCLLRLIILVVRYRPDIIHTHTPKAGLLGMLAGWLCRVPVRLHTVAGLPEMEACGMKKTILRLTEKITVYCSHRVYPNSDGLRKYMITELGISPRKLKVLGAGSSNGIDLDYFQRSGSLARHAESIRNQFGIGVHDLVFSFVGRLVTDKGIVELMTAFVHLKLPVHVWLLLVGHQEKERDPLPAKTVELMEKNPHVILAGFQEDVRPWMLASDIFVFPSYREGFPNVLMQACALGIPSIATDINGCNEIINPDKSGLLVKPKDTIGLQHAMEEMAGNSLRRAGMAALANQFVRENLDRSLFWAGLYDEYCTMMDLYVPGLH